MGMKQGIAVIAAGTIAAFSASAAHAADFETERALGLVISGSYESWIGATFIGEFDTDGGGDTPEDDVHFMSGGEARLSFPLGDTLSMQQDFKYEINSEQLTTDDSSTGVDDFYGDHYQATTHFSFLRDPSTGVLGVFGGWGGGYADGDESMIYFVGGEFQYYAGAWMFQGQGGYTNGDSDDSGDPEALRDAWFVRGLARWYMDADTRLQIEASYVDGVVDGDEDEAKLYEWGARYNTLVTGLPLVGDTNVFVRYRGSHAENRDVSDNGFEEFNDHTFMVGMHWSFGGTTRQEHDRIGVALDSPDIARWSLSGEVLD